MSTSKLTMQSESIWTSQQTSVKRPNHPKEDWFHKPGSNLKHHEVGFTTTWLATRMQYECGSNSGMWNNPRGPKIATSTFELHTSVLQKTITKNSHSPSAASQKMVPAYLSDPKYPHNQQPKRKTPPTHRKTPMAPDPSPKKLINLGMGAAPAAQTQGWIQPNTNWSSRQLLQTT